MNPKQIIFWTMLLASCLCILAPILIAAGCLLSALLRK